MARPRTPQAWRQTVARMANRSTILNPITEDDQWFVTAYLIAVSPTLQETLKQRRRMEELRIKSQENMASVANMTQEKDYEYEAVTAKTLFEQKCAQCHGLEQVVQKPPGTDAETVALVRRMVGNGLTASESELNIIMRCSDPPVPDRRTGQEICHPAHGNRCNIYLRKFPCPRYCSYRRPLARQFQIHLQFPIADEAVRILLHRFPSDSE